MLYPVFKMRHDTTGKIIVLAIFLLISDFPPTGSNNTALRYLKKCYDRKTSVIDILRE